ncbi:MAG: heparin lyase I family protein [Bacteroidota bacterium]
MFPHFFNIPKTGRYGILLFFLTLGSSCDRAQNTNAVTNQQSKGYIEESESNEEYFSGISNQFEKSFINKRGMFFDDFEKLPKHIGGANFKKKSVTRYSYHSLVEKENWKPKNKSIELVKEGGNSYLKSTLAPGQLHPKINGYRAELTLHGGNPDIREEWYEWRLMIPTDYDLDEENIGREVSIVQFHYVKPKKEKKVIAGPTINFTYMEQYSKNILLLRYGIHGEKESKYNGFKWRPIALNDEIIKGKWYTLRVNINWSKTNQGYIAVWLNGKPFTPFNGINNKVYGANLYNDIENTLKFGYYRYWDNSKPTAIYFDYLVKARTFEQLTGNKPTIEELYGVQEDYRYLEDKIKALTDVRSREDMK